MAYTFGAGAGDDINFNTFISLGATSRACLICGWWYPTTLTATRKLWSARNTGVFGAEIDATTSELRLRTDNTTDGQWTTTGVGLATNEWKFLAFLSTTLNGTPDAAWRVWAGSIESAPVECTVTVATAPVGNFVGTNLLYIGNAGTGSLAFEGDIGSGRLYASGNVTGTSSPFSLAALGAITNTEAEFVYQRFVVPAWEGKPWKTVGSHYAGGGISSSADYDMYMWDFDQTLPQVIAAQSGAATTFAGITPTINGATPSENRTPRPMNHRAIHPVPCFGP